MYPVSPVVKGFEEEKIVFAKDQPEYQPLPAIRTVDGIVISRFTFNQRLQPQLPSVYAPQLHHI